MGKKHWNKTNWTEYHLTFTNEMGCGESGKCLSHIDIPITRTTGGVLEEEIVNVLQESDCVHCLKSVLKSSTHTNSGWEDG